MKYEPDKQHHIPDYEIAQYSREFEEKRLVQEFADYLNVGEISGTTRGVPKGSVIESEFVTQSNVHVEVVRDALVPDDHNHLPITVLLHKDERADIRSIEVMCSCGKRAIINLEYDGDAELNAIQYADSLAEQENQFTEFADMPGQSG